MPIDQTKDLRNKDERSSGQSQFEEKKNRKAHTRLVIVTGLAGAGKTVAIRALEDLGFHCIDNLPSILLEDFVTSIISGSFNHKNLALALDTRDPHMVKTLVSKSETLSQLFQFEVLFLDADEATVLKRFRETRRRHPLSFAPNQESNEQYSASATKPLTLREAILLDIETLQPIKEMADRVINTSQMTADFLRRLIRNKYATSIESLDLHLNIISFGFKHGVPQDVDSVFDVRCFKNPHYVDELRPLTGLDPRVQEYVFSDPQVSQFIIRVVDLLKFLYPMYCNEGKKYFGLGIGCTGGKHRSVAISEEIQRNLGNALPFVTVEHRHFDKE